MNLDISVMSGAGNKFIVLDNRKYKISLDEGSELAQTLCAGNDLLPRTEGLLLIDDAPASSGLHFIMTFFNPDGSHGAMCGNGGRCAVHFAERQGFFAASRTPEVWFSVAGISYRAEVNRIRNSVCLYFPEPEEIAFPIMLMLEGGIKLTAGYVNVGSDHAVIWFPEAGGVVQGGFNNFNIEHWGSLIRHHSSFPRGANANFYTVVGEQTLRLRTFERGVEAETGACGTGAISTAIIAHLRHDMMPPIHVIPPSGSELIVNFYLKNDGLQNISLEGAAQVLKTVTVAV
ncbi:MAG: diaminopimelate epimerase [Bacteroidota bacterium]|nr:diaminopimelate epimerase [Candidatus Kapabacteria bacterium]MDW8219947.1 diaminopimelate epimerase [Bacteroidota bacterium]